MAISSVDELVSFVRENALIEERFLADFGQRLAPRYANRFDLLVELLNRKWLSQYQFDVLFQETRDALTLGDFVLLEPRGSGTMGQVYKARRRADGQVVALKTFREDTANDPLAMRRFLREIHAVSRLAHPNVVRMIDAGAEKDQRFFVMEWVDGVDLASLVEQVGPLPVDTALEFTRQAALGLQHAHERGLIHRDVKPANLLLDEEAFAIKVFDLGLVRLTPAAELGGMTHLTFEDDLIGTPDYVAPEQILTPLEIDARADIYSLGCTLYFLLTGGPPFPGPSGTLKLTRQVNEEPASIAEVRPEVPAPVMELTKRLMAKQPADRPSTMTEVAERLAAILPTVKTEEGPSDPVA